MDRIKRLKYEIFNVNNMFGKNKNYNKSSDNEEVGVAGKIVMHTMEDDLNSDYDIENKKPSSVYEGNLKKISTNKNKSTEIKSPFLNSGEKSIPKEHVSASGFPQKIEDNLPKSATKPVSEQLWSGKKTDTYNDKNESNLSKMGTTIEDRLAKVRNASLKKSENKYEIKEDQKNTDNAFKKIAYIGLFLIITVLIGVGGYYSFINKEQIMSFLNINSANNEKKLENNQADIKKEPENNFSDKSNFLMIDELTKEDIISSINQTFDKMPENKLLEFVIVDKDNVALLFPELSNALGLTLDSEVMRNLGDNFSVFLYKKSNDNKRVSLVIDISNKKLLSGSISTNSGNLVQAIEPVFLNAQVSPEKEASGFNTSSYENVSIRYNNLSQDTDLSIDYAIIGDKFMLATSKDSGRLIIDKLIIESKSADNSELDDSENIISGINNIENEDSGDVVVDVN